MAHAHNVKIVNNTIKGFVNMGGDLGIEPPSGYWGYGRARVGINIEDSSHIDINGNTIADLSTGTPIGIRVVNSRFTCNPEAGPYSVVGTKAPDSIDYNSDIIIRNNKVVGKSGHRIGYYIENQKNVLSYNNSSLGCMSNRIIASTSTIRKNHLNCGVCTVDSPKSSCKRMIMNTHPMHPNGIPLANWKYSSPTPVYNEFFPESLQ